MRSLFCFCFLWTYISNAQINGDSTLGSKDSVILDTFNFDLKIYKGKGELTFISQKSKSTGGTYQIRLATGEWQYFDEKEVLRIKGNYKVKGTQSNKSGRWEYYDDQEELLMVENFPPLKYSLVYLKSFAVKTEGGYDIINYNNEDILEKQQYTPPQRKMTPSITYYINYMNDSLIKFNYDTIVAMDNRNEQTWLMADPKSKTINAELNLIENSSFENANSRLTNGSKIGDHISNWQASAGTPDYYRSKNLNTMDGDAMVGVRFYTENWAHIEFLSTQLKETLEANKTYCLKIYVRLKEDCFYGVNALGALLSDKIPNQQALIQGDVMPTIKHHKGSVLAYKTKWMQLSCTYTAKGNEDYLTLGSFTNSDTMQKKHLKGNVTEAYYFFDNIQLYAIEKPEECPCNIGRKEKVLLPHLPISIEKEVPKSFVIRNIFFDNDKWDLLPESFDALDSLYDVIETNMFKKVEISGHTSNTGSRERNLYLSKNRAEAVKKYLVKKGLSPKMFVCIGYGPDLPIADNDTQEGQSENRRVEFKLLE